MARSTPLPPDDDQSFGARLIRLRSLKGWRRKDLSEWLDKEGLHAHHITITRWENEGILPINGLIQQRLEAEFEKENL